METDTRPWCGCYGRTVFRATCRPGLQVYDHDQNVWRRTPNQGQSVGDRQQNSQNFAHWRPRPPQQDDNNRNAAARGPAPAVWAELTPDQMAQGDLGDIPGPHPGPHFPESPGSHGKNNACSRPPTFAAQPMNSMPNQTSTSSATGLVISSMGTPRARRMHQTKRIFIHQGRALSCS